MKKIYVIAAIALGVAMFDAKAAAVGIEFYDAEVVAPRGRVAVVGCQSEIRSDMSGKDNVLTFWTQVAKLVGLW